MPTGQTFDEILAHYRHYQRSGGRLEFADWHLKWLAYWRLRREETRTGIVSAEAGRLKRELLLI